MNNFQYVCFSVVNRNIKSPKDIQLEFQGLNTKNKNSLCCVVVNVTDKYVLTTVNIVFNKVSAPGRLNLDHIRS